MGKFGCTCFLLCRFLQKLWEVILKDSDKSLIFTSYLYTFYKLMKKFRNWSKSSIILITQRIAKKICQLFKVNILQYRWFRIEELKFQEYFNNVKLWYVECIPREEYKPEIEPKGFYWERKLKKLTAWLKKRVHTFCSMHIIL